MNQLTQALLTCLFAAALAVGSAFGIVAALNATPEQPNVPLVSFPDRTAHSAAPAPSSPDPTERD
jgi:hypothetical protein